MDPNRPIVGCETNYEHDVAHAVAMHGPAPACDDIIQCSKPEADRRPCNFNDIVSTVKRRVLGGSARPGAGPGGPLRARRPCGASFVKSLTYSSASAAARARCRPADRPADRSAITAGPSAAERQPDGTGRVSCLLRRGAE